MIPKSPVRQKRGPVRDRRVWLERRAFELSKACPAEPANPCDCPLCELRPKPARERKAWISGLSDDELEYLASYHGCCYEEKLRRLES
jgi:hypothetical protein